jgi:type VI secretion system protein ImpF
MADRDTFELRPSLMDRLVDEQLGGSSLLDESLFVDVDTYLDSIRGDLEDLLNTRFHVPAAMLEPFDELPHSMLSYGLPDMSHASSRNASDREGIRRHIESAIAAFDTRLSDVSVDLDSSGDPNDRKLVFRVDAVVDLRPAKERVVFDAALNLATSRYEISDGVAE